MISREIIHELIAKKQCPERMGLFEHYWGDTQPWWEEHEGLAKGIDLVEHFNYDIRIIDGSWFNTSAFLEGAVLEETEETKVHVNGWGAKFRDWKHKSGTPEHLGFEMTTEEIWRKKFREPMLSLDTKRFGDIEVLRANYKKAMAEKRFAVYSNLTIFEQMRESMGQIVMMESMCLNPVWIHDFCDVMTNHLIMHLEYLLREVGIPDGIWLYEDMGYTYQPFISPELQREMIMPYHKRLGDFFKSYKLPWIMHSCGKIRPFLPAIREAGVDCLQVLEAKAGQDVREFADAVGNSMAFMGNLNIRAFETNDMKTVESEVLPKLRDIKKKRIPYIFHSDHSIPRTVRLSTYQGALDMFWKNCAY
jgi:uroporphyrinogen decarboxylase